MKNTTLLILPFILFLAVFFYAPFLVLAYYSILEDDGGVGLGNYIEIIRDPAYTRVIIYSILLAGETTLATLILSLPAAYYIALHARGPEKTALLVAFITPFWIDFLLRALAIRNILYLFDVREGYASMLAGMIYDYLPFMFLPIYATLSTIPRQVLDAAKSLGATTRHTVTKIIIPLSLPGIAAGSVLVFLMSMTEYVIPALLGGTKGFTVGTLIYYLFLSGDKWGAGSALTIVITATLLVAAVAVARRAGARYAQQ